MSSIKFNYLTKEIEMEDSEAFIESNFQKNQDLLVESFGAKIKMVSRRIKANREPIAGEKVKESQVGAEAKRHEPSEAPPILTAIKYNMPEISHEFQQKRAPLRKYIRKTGSPGHQQTVVEIVEQKPKAISLGSLREKFGLSDAKIGGIIRDAAKLGKIKRGLNGSYVWAQE